MKRIIFMGTPEFSTYPLEDLAKADGISVELVITGEDKIRSRNKVQACPVKMKAQELGLSIYQTEKINSDETFEVIESIKPDFIVVIAFGHIMGKRLLETYKDRIINIHSSLLPKFRGAAPMQWAILNKEKETGVCSMLIEKSMDTGDILSCAKMDLTEDTGIEEVHDTLAKLSGPLIVDTILNYEEKMENRIVQDDSLASYSGKIDKEMGHISFNEKAEDIKAKIMAFSVWPSTFVIYKGQNMKIHKINIIEKYTDTEEAKIIDVSKEGIFVNCLDKCIVIEEIQMPGKKRMTLESYLNGNNIEISEFLN